MQKWIYEKNGEKIAEEALTLPEQGFKSGRRLYKDRSGPIKRGQEIRGKQPYHQFIHPEKQHDTDRY